MAVDEQALAISMHPSIAPARASKAVPRLAAATVGVAALATVLPLALIAPAALVAVLGVVAFETGAPRARRALADYAAWRARAVRRQARESTLVSAGCSVDTLVDLDRTVVSIELRDRDLARRLDLEALLDRHAALTVAHARAIAAVTMADRVQLERIRDMHRSDPRHDPRRLELCERRLQCLDECEAKVQSFADELAIIADVVRLLGQRVACPEDLPADDVIDGCLAELDARDAAQRQLVAEPI